MLHPALSSVSCVTATLLFISPCEVSLAIQNALTVGTLTPQRNCSQCVCVCGGLIAFRKTDAKIPPIVQLDSVASLVSVISIVPVEIEKTFITKVGDEREKELKSRHFFIRVVNRVCSAGLQKCISYQFIASNIT